MSNNEVWFDNFEVQLKHQSNLNLYLEQMVDNFGLDLNVLEILGNSGMGKISRDSGLFELEGKLLIQDNLVNEMLMSNNEVWSDSFEVQLNHQYNLSFYLGQRVDNFGLDLHTLEGKLMM